MRVTGARIPSKGDQVEQRRTGTSRVGYVWHADHLQVLVKWEDGTSSSLRLGRDQFLIKAVADETARESLKALALSSFPSPRPRRLQYRDAG